jgi:hypothetical protein
MYMIECEIKKPYFKISYTPTKIFCSNLFPLLLHNTRLSRSNLFVLNSFFFLYMDDTLYCKKSIYKMPSGKGAGSLPLDYFARGGALSSKGLLLYRKQHDTKQQSLAINITYEIRRNFLRC